VTVVRAWLAGGAAGTRHQGFPVVDGAGWLLGVVTRRELMEEAVVKRDAPWTLVGILTRSDLLAAHHRRLQEAHEPERGWGAPRSSSSSP
jgi:CIC family chloride channel protein